LKNFQNNVQFPLEAIPEVFAIPCSRLLVVGNPMANFVEILAAVKKKVIIEAVRKTQNIL
jgi:hypothetical protein